MTQQLTTLRSTGPMSESTWYDESAGLDPREDDRFGAPGDEDEDDLDEDDDDFRD
jgi:hypothetical protein